MECHDLSTDQARKVLFQVQGTAGYLGNAPIIFGTNMGLNATLDEVRIINVARSASWIAAEAANQANPSTFYSVSAEQTP